MTAMSTASAAEHTMCVHIAADPALVAHVRHIIRSALTAWGVQQAADDVILIASELVGNAIRHGAAVGIEVLLATQDEALLLEVADGGDGVPTARDAAEDDEDGRGLLIVQTLADKYGWRSNDKGGTTVWARLVLPAGWSAA